MAVNYYGSESSTRIDDFLKFDTILHGDETQIDSNKLELELSKIAVVLLGIGVLDKNGPNFMSAVLKVPLEKHYDVLAIIQSVVQAGSSEVLLTSRIEDILCEPTGTSQEARPNTPTCNILKSNFMELPQASTPKDASKAWTSATIAAPGALPSSPLRLNLTLLNSSLRDITSPLRGLSIDTSSSSSPLTQYAQSPQLIQKAILRQKETELRKLKRQLEEHIDQADELKYLLQDQTETVSKKDAVIAGLEKKVQELQRQTLHNELKDSTDADNESTISKLTQKVQSLERYKELYLELEKESSVNAEEQRKLYDEIQDLEQKISQYKATLKSQNQLSEDMEDQRMQMELLKEQLEHMKKAKSSWESERVAMQETISSLREQNSSLRNQMEDLQPFQAGK
ncbi:nuclear mitotic apparatus protein 1 [Plakobranchus ocellatus]|uniref:Nuclear mitotic apparatus protein 1 n=1 Tax=Plakobranchus ocellatus TaxID=259542 RepID=A0AAV3YHZ3_9GAST|nr:nuclear mitotic apparatus protein 1 [Plakobranchus ocellatus]